MKPVDAVTMKAQGFRIANTETRAKNLPPPTTEPQAGVRQDRSALLREILDEIGMQHGRLSPVRLDYSVHKSTGRLMVDVVDRETGEVLRTVPPEKLLNTLARIMEYVGLMLDETV